MYYIRKDPCIDQPVTHFRGGHVIIDPPAQIPGAGIEPETPPGIMMGLIVKNPECINKSFFQEFGHPFSFLRQKSGGIFI